MKTINKVREFISRELDNKAIRDKANRYFKLWNYKKAIADFRIDYIKEQYNITDIIGFMEQLELDLIEGFYINDSINLNCRKHKNTLYIYVEKSEQYR